MTEEQKKISKHNRRKARKYFRIEGNGNLDLHHVDETLKHNDVERYIQWNPEDLVVMTHSEHSKLHNAGQKNAMFGKESPFKGRHHTDEAKAKVSKANKGKTSARKGVVLTEETKKKISNSLIGKPSSCKGRHWYNNGINNIRAFECPEGYETGILKRRAS